MVAIGASVDDLLATPDADQNLGYSVEFCGGTHLTNTAQVGRARGASTACLPLALLVVPADPLPAHGVQRMYNLPISTGVSCQPCMLELSPCLITTSPTTAPTPTRRAPLHC